jgi:Gpi18-like mannosyltransferase
VTITSRSVRNKQTNTAVATGLLVFSQIQLVHMVQLSNRRIQSLILVLVSAIPRVLGAFFLPNAFGDAYVYIRDIGTLSTKISSGTFRLTDLFGFWLPLYQLLSAIANVFVKNGFYSGKLVSASFGAGACLLVYGITLRLTGNQRAALVMFLLIALNPLHIFYSASAMTDVPHAFFVLAALYFVLKRNWIAAAVFGALAGFTRVESWMLIALIPLIQLIRDRRISFVALAILIAPPLFWFYVSWKATGDWLACFVQRQEYHDWLLRMNPSIAQFSIRNILRDGATLLVSSDVAVLAAVLFAAWFVLRRLPRAFRSDSVSEALNFILAPVLFFTAFFGLLLVSYLAHQQPIIFPRYGLILFTFGLPILAWAFLTLRQHKPQLARRVLIGIVVICTLDASIQLVGAVGEVNRYSTQRAVADYLRDHFDRNSNAQIFCDEGTVRVLSGISADRFVTSADAPRDREGFLNFLRDKNVEYMVFVVNQDSMPVRLFPDGEYGEPIGSFRTVMSSHAEFLYTNIWLYRVESAAP